MWSNWRWVFLPREMEDYTGIKTKNLSIFADIYFDVNDLLHLNTTLLINCLTLLTEFRMHNTTLLEEYSYWDFNLRVPLTSDRKWIKIKNTTFWLIFAGCYALDECWFVRCTIDHVFSNRKISSLLEQVILTTIDNFDAKSIKWDRRYV